MIRLFQKHGCYLLVFALGYAILHQTEVVAEQFGNSFGKHSGKRSQKISSKAPRNAFDSSLSIFSPSITRKHILKVTNVTERKSKEKSHSLHKNNGRTPPSSSARSTKRPEISFVSNDPKDVKILPPDQTPKVRINPDAPTPAIAMIAAIQQGDRHMAKQYGGQFVRYLQDYFFTLNAIVDTLGEVLKEQDLINDDEWVGASQAINYHLAKTRLETGALVKPTHKEAMKRIKPDSKQRAHIYYFFTLNCHYCRYMAPNIERLWQLTKYDKKVKMHVMTIGGTNKAWLEEYKQYTGLTMPIVDGTAVAKDLSIGFVPAVVVVAPSSARAYLKTGEQDFQRLYEFVRTVQGLPARITKRFKQLASYPVGQVERSHQRSQLARVKVGKNSRKNTNKAFRKPKRVKVELGTF